MTLLHATCIALDAVGILLRGASGAGKSDLALRLIDEGAVLVADDYCEVERMGHVLIARARATIAGKMEIRGQGVVELPYLANAPVGLVLDLMPADQIPRLPEQTTCTIEDVTLPWMYLDPAAASATARIRVAMRHIPQPKRMLR
jgi:serine kinase of HPr protein (carbohydrate metabolism regulator)